MASHTFFCIDAHTCGEPVRIVAGGAPFIPAATAMERRTIFAAQYDWIRTALVYEPRGHDLMAGTVLYPPTRADCDVGIVFIEATGCVPMCGHGTIGTVTAVIERGIVTPRTPGRLRLDTPAGVVDVRFEMEGEYVSSVSLTNVPSYLDAVDVPINVPGLGDIRVDVAYGGNFYAIVEPQEGFRDLSAISMDDILRLSPIVMERVNENRRFVHPEQPGIAGVDHVMWTGLPRTAGATSRNAVFVGTRTVDRSPCGTGTCARMAQLVGKGQLKVGDNFIHESIIGSLFTGRAEEMTKVGDRPAIVPTVKGWARVTGLNTIFVDDRDPYAHGFQVT